MSNRLGAFEESKNARAAGWGRRRAEIEARTGVAVELFAALHSKLAGTLVLAGDDDYDKARQLAGPTFQKFPIAIARCRTAGDVRATLATARRARWNITCRAGGHSTGGFSVNDGIVIDVSGLSYALVDPAAMTLRAGSGTPFDLFMAAIDAYGLHVVGGGCGDVCIGGYLQGGGYGFSSLRFGMHSDNAVALHVMLADGSEVVASATENPDLFWAMRGGTGNNFGVLLEATYRLVPLPRLWGFVLSWPIASAATAMVALQAGFMKAAVPKLLGYMGMLAYKHGKPTLSIAGMVDGSEAEGRELLRPLFADGAEETMSMSGSYRELDTKLVAGLCPLPLPKRGFKQEKQAGYVARALGREEWQAVMDYYVTTPSENNVMIVEPYGGAIRAVAADASAFVHRDVYMDLVFEGLWYEASGKAPTLKWLNTFRDDYSHLVNGHVYQNYPRRGLDDFRWRYWGQNFPTLLWVKHKYDPSNVFTFEQSISPYPHGESPSKPMPDRVLFSDRTIEYRYRPS